MRLLLDTHIWLWSLADPSRLGQGVVRELGNGQNEIWLSPISSWEIGILARKGRIRLERGVQQWVRDALQRGPFREAPLNHEIAIESLALDLPISDPADKFLASTARVYDLVLVTADRQLLESPQVSTMPNR